MHLDKLRGMPDADSIQGARVEPRQCLPQTGLVTDQNQMQFGMISSDLQRRGHDDIRSMVATHGVKRDRQSTRHSW